MLIRAKNYLINTKDFMSISAHDDGNCININFDIFAYIIKLKPDADGSVVLDFIISELAEGKPMVTMSDFIVERVDMSCYMSEGDGSDFPD